MLDANIKKQLEAYFQNLKTPVEIVVSLDDSAKSEEMASLAKDLESLSSQITLREGDNALERRPSMAIQGQDQRPAIRFAGLPMGHEFNSLVLAILQSGGHPAKLEAGLIEQIKQLEGEFHFETYISLSCQNCPRGCSGSEPDGGPESWYQPHHDRWRLVSG